MKIIRIFVSLGIVSSLSACLSSESGSGSDQAANVDRVRDPLAIDCRTLGYEAVKALTTEVLQVPLTATLSTGQSLDEFLNSNTNSLGGVGVNESRSCSLGYFKTVSQLGMLSCEWLTANNPSLLFPQGASDSSYAFVSMTGLNPSSDESANLNELAGQFSGAKQTTAVCAAIYASLAAQTL